MSGEEYPRVAQLGDSEWWYVVWGNGYVSTMPDRRTAILCANAAKMQGAIEQAVLQLEGPSLLPATRTTMALRILRDTLLALLAELEGE